VRNIGLPYANATPWNMMEIMLFLQPHCKEPIERNTIYHLLAREPSIKACRGVPMEDKRMQVTSEQIIEYF
jgi:hypothetical protein